MAATTSGRLSGSDWAPGVPCPGDPGGGDDADAAVELSVVVPFYNTGADTIGRTVRDATAELEAAGVSFEIVAVSDGSTDGSEQGVLPFVSDRVRLVVISANRGKGWAVRTGLAIGRGAFLGFIDGDGDIPVALLPDMLELAREAGADIVVGSKRHPASLVASSRRRRAYSRGYQLVIGLLFGLQVRDTQTGIKIARRAVVEDVLPFMEEDRFAFDVELLALAKRRGHDVIVEAPVTIGPRSQSTISLRTIASMAGDTFALARRLDRAPCRSAPPVDAASPGSLVPATRFVAGTAGVEVEGRLAQV